MNLTEPRELAPLLEAFLLASGKPQGLERLYELFEENERPEPAVSCGTEDAGSAVGVVSGVVVVVISHLPANRTRSSRA